MKIILELAAAAQRAERSSLWKTDIDKAIENHGDACDALWNHLYALLAERADIKPAKIEKIEDIRASVKKEIMRDLRQELPQLVQMALDEV